MRLRYQGDGGFYEKLSEIRAIESVRIPLQEEAFFIDIAKIESGKIQPYAEEFVLQDVVHEVCESLKTQIKDKGLELRAELPEAPVRLNTDRRRLLQCLLNYPGNAVKFTERGSIAVPVREEGERVTLSIADTGIGIKESNMGLLFTSFVRPIRR